MDRSRRPYIEGEAVIEEVGDEPDRYWVAFPGDPVPRLRYVYEVCQSRALVTALQKIFVTEARTAAESVLANDNVSTGRPE